MVTTNIDAGVLGIPSSESASFTNQRILHNKAPETTFRHPVSAAAIAAGPLLQRSVVTLNLSNELVLAQVGDKIAGVTVTQVNQGQANPIVAIYLDGVFNVSALVFHPTLNTVALKKNAFNNNGSQVRATTNDYENTNVI